MSSQTTRRITSPKEKRVGGNCIKFRALVLSCSRQRHGQPKGEQYALCWLLQKTSLQSLCMIRANAWQTSKPQPGRLHRKDFVARRSTWEDSQNNALGLHMHTNLVFGLCLVLLTKGTYLQHKHQHWVPRNCLGQTRSNTQARKSTYPIRNQPS